jgi:hypothetical protein
MLRITTQVRLSGMEEARDPQCTAMLVKEMMVMNNIEQR